MLSAIWAKTRCHLKLRIPVGPLNLLYCKFKFLDDFFGSILGIFWNHAKPSLGFPGHLSQSYPKPAAWACPVFGCCTRNTHLQTKDNIHDTSNKTGSYHYKFRVSHRRRQRLSKCHDSWGLKRGRVHPPRESLEVTVTVTTWNNWTNSLMLSDSLSGSSTLHIFSKKKSFKSFFPHAPPYHPRTFSPTLLPTHHHCHCWRMQLDCGICSELTSIWTTNMHCNRKKPLSPGGVIVLVFQFHWQEDPPPRTTRY